MITKSELQDWKRIAEQGNAVRVAPGTLMKFMHSIEELVAELQFYADGGGTDEFEESQIGKDQLGNPVYLHGHRARLILSEYEGKT